VYYQRFAHPVGLEAERLLGELEGGQALLFPSGAGATTALVLGLLEPGVRIAVADGGYWAPSRCSPTRSAGGASRSWGSIRPGRRRRPTSCGWSRARIR